MAKSFFKKIIVAVNGRTSSIHAAMYAIMMAKTYSLDLKFIFVIDEATIKYLSMNNLLISDERRDFTSKITEDGQRYLDYVQMLAGSKGVKCERELRKGGVFTEILKAAEEFEADLILLGGSEHFAKRDKVSKANILNAAQSEILAGSKCPVMLVQQPMIEEKFKAFK